MNRPYTTCHILSSLDGKINGSFMAAEATRAVAGEYGKIRAEMNGTHGSIQTETIYPADGGKLIDYAAEEQDEDARPVLTSHIEDLDSYDVIFVGFPTWLAYHNLIQCTQA